MQDFLLDSDGDLLFTNGDLSIGDSDNQHIFDIITCFTGSFKENPQLGSGVMQFIKSENPKKGVNVILQQLQSDGYQVSNVSLKINNGNLVIDFPQGITRNG